VYNRALFFGLFAQKVPHELSVIIALFGLRGFIKTALRHDRRIAPDQLTTILPRRDKTEFFIGIGGSFYESARYGRRSYSECSEFR
jgi:hypothetical protein